MGSAQSAPPVQHERVQPCVQIISPVACTAQPVSEPTPQQRLQHPSHVPPAIVRQTPGSSAASTAVALGTLPAFGLPEVSEADIAHLQAMEDFAVPSPAMSDEEFFRDFSPEWG
jgi:hypothetical protein